VKGKHGFPENIVVHHLHPLGVIGNFGKVGNELITLDMLKKVFTEAPNDNLRVIVDELNSNLAGFKLDTALRLTHFFAQTREEGGASMSLTENLNYQASALPGLFGYFATHPAEAQTYGRTSAHPADQVAIANRAYANRYGNGNVASGDGWRYRGRGLKQLTFRDNYRDLDNRYQGIFGETSPGFEANPDLLGAAKYGFRSAVFFWLRHKLYEKADQGATDAAVNSITAVINLHTDSYARRRQHFHHMWNARLFNDALP
jgi:predicted chitinase